METPREVYQMLLFPLLKDLQAVTLLLFSINGRIVAIVDRVAVNSTCRSSKWIVKKNNKISVLEGA